MASEKKIMMFDESTGMLTLDVMTAYINNELSPSLRGDVENFLAKDEMHRDIIEGLKLMRDKHLAEKTIHFINEKIAGRTGAEVKSSLSFEIPPVLTEYRKMAAVIGGILAISGILFTLMLLREAPSGIASSEQEIDQQETVQTKAAPPPHQEAITVEEKITKADDTPAGLAAGTFADTIITEQDSAAFSAKATGMNEIAELTNRRSSAEIAPEERRLRPSAKKLMTDDISTPAKGAEITSLAAPSAANGDTGIADSNAQASDTVAASLDAKEQAAVSVKQAPAANMEMPEFPGGEAGLRKYIRDNLIYPKEAKDNGVQGSVELEFYVGTTGRVKNIRVTKGVSKDINAEAVRLITDMPKWKPGKLDGKSSTLQQHLTIDFVIE